MTAAADDRTRTHRFNRSVRASLLENAIRWILHAAEPQAGRSFFDASGRQPMSNAHRLQIEGALRNQLATFPAQAPAGGGWRLAACKTASKPAR